MSNKYRRMTPPTTLVQGLTTPLTTLSTSYFEAWSRFNPSVPPELHALRWHGTDARVAIGALLAHVVFVIILAGAGEVSGPFQMRWSRTLFSLLSCLTSAFFVVTLLNEAHHLHYGFICNNGFPGRIMPGL